MSRGQAGAAAMIDVDVAERESDYAFAASQSVVAVFKFDKKEYSFQIEGRGPSVLGSKQGDHVTAYALVKRGFARSLQGLELTSDESLTSLKERRVRIYDFISKIAVVDENSRDGLYAGITGILRDYNQSRFKKSEIKSIKRFAKTEEEKGSELAPTILEHMDREKLSNGRLIQSSLERMAETLMTFYNQAPNTAYLQIEGFKAASNEGPAVTAAINFLDNFETEYKSTLDREKTAIERQVDILKTEAASSRERTKATKEEEIKSASQRLENLEQELRGKLFGSVIEKIFDLFFYPEIRDASALEKHKRETTALNKPRATARNNSEEDLTSALAKHMHIVFAAFPELTTHLNQDDLTRAFVNRVTNGPYQVKVKDKNETIKHGWPSICGKADKDAIITKISDAVVKDVKTLQTKSEQNLYSKTAEFKSVESSKNPSSHVSSRRDSEKAAEGERSRTSEGEEERGGGGLRDKDLQRQVVSGISDDDFMKELERRMGGEAADKTLLQQVQTEIEENQVLDKDELLANLDDLKRELILSKSRSNLDQESFAERFSDAIFPTPIPNLSAIKLNDNNHYSEIIEAIHSKISTKGEIRLKEFHKIITEEFQKDYQSSKSTVHKSAAR